MSLKRLHKNFQDEFLFNHLSIKENLNYPMKLKGVNPRIGQTSNFKIDQAIELFRLNSKKNNTNILARSIFELSKGERQRIALLRGLLCDRKILLADEPTGNLDETSSDLIFLLLKVWQLLGYQGNTNTAERSVIVI